MFPNPFTDDEIESKRKELCGKCYKLDRASDHCERYDVPLKIFRPNLVPLYEKCDECKAFSRVR